MKVLYYPQDHDDGSKPVIEEPKFGTGTPEDPTHQWDKVIENVEVNIDEQTVTVYTGTWYIELLVTELDMLNAAVKEALRSALNELREAVEEMLLD